MIVKKLEMKKMKLILENKAFIKYKKAFISSNRPKLGRF